MRLGLSAVLAGAVIATTGAPAVLAAPAAPTAGQVTETPAEQARRLNSAGYQAKADAEQAALAAGQATTKDAALTALAAAQTVKNAAAQVKRDVIAFIDVGLPGTTDDDRVTAVQGHAAADVAIDRANAAIEVALRKAADNPRNGRARSTRQRRRRRPTPRTPRSRRIRRTRRPPRWPRCGPRGQLATRLLRLTGTCWPSSTTRAR